MTEPQLRIVDPDTGELRAAVDAYEDAKGKRHDRLGLIFENAERVEDFCNRYARWQKRQAA